MGSAAGRYVEVTLGVRECSALTVIKHYFLKIWGISEKFSKYGELENMGN